MNAYLRGFGSYVPPRVVTNADMIEMVDRHNPEVSRLRKLAYFRTVQMLYNRAGACTRSAVGFTVHRRRARRAGFRASLPSRRPGEWCAV